MAKVRPLPPHLAEVARRELNEDPARLEEDLKHLRDWLAKQPHLTARTDDQFLLAFLRGTKFSLERAKEKLDAYYTLRTALPDFFSNRDPTDPIMQKILKQGVILPLGKDAQGRQVTMVRNGAFNASEISMTQVFKMNFMMIDTMILEDDDLIVNGQVAIIDLADVTLTHAAQLTPPFIKRAMTFVQEGFPIRPKGINYINTMPAFETIFNIFKSFMKEKLKKRISIHKDLESLYENVPKEILPKEYGGKGGSAQEIADHWTAKMTSWRDYFLEDAKFCADESKRRGRPKTHEDLFGLEGSFRTLNVD